MATTKEDLIGAVDKLIADLAVQSSAMIAKSAADAAVFQATSGQGAAAEDVAKAHEAVTADLASLKDIADKLADGDDNT